MTSFQIISSSANIFSWRVQSLCLVGCIAKILTFNHFCSVFIIRFWLLYKTFPIFELFDLNMPFSDMGQIVLFISIRYIVQTFWLATCRWRFKSCLFHDVRWVWGVYLKSKLLNNYKDWVIKNNLNMEFIIIRFNWFDVPAF